MSLTTKAEKKLKKLHKALADALREQVAPLILHVYLQQLDGIRQGRYCTARVLYAYLFMLTEMCGRPHGPARARAAVH